ncbi:MAG: hypothetical protein EBR86_10805 [Planctomycetia bacterium]|nr:hypothetical protein [Planctomycetia bacterium]
MSVSDDSVEQATSEWFEELGYAYLAGPGIAPGEPGAERDSYGDVVLQGWLTAAIDRLNPMIPFRPPHIAVTRVGAVSIK